MEIHEVIYILTSSSPLFYLANQVNLSFELGFEWRKENGAEDEAFFAPLGRLGLAGAAGEGCSVERARGCLWSHAGSVDVALCRPHLLSSDCSLLGH